MEETPHELGAQAALSWPSPLTLGRRTFIAGVAGALAGATVFSGAAGAVEAGASQLTPMAPVRICDTRKNLGFRRLEANLIRVKLAGIKGIPSQAVAVVMTVTGVNLKSGGNWISVYPAGTTWPGTSSLNSEHWGQAIANLATVKLGRGGGDATGSVDVRSLASTHVVIDVVGYYLATTGPVSAGRFEAVDPFRVVDTRPRRPAAGATIPVDLNGFLPSHLDVQAVVANITAVGTASKGFFTTYPMGEARPTASSLNYGRGEVRAGATIAKLGRTGGRVGFNIYTLSSAHAVVDVVGFITGPGAPTSDAGLFVPMTPQRLLDTRRRRRRVWPGGTATFALPSSIASKASAVAMNLSVTSTINPGYFTAYAARTPRRVVSSLNAIRTGQTVANHAFSKVSTAGVSCFSQNGAHVIADVTGWYTGGATRATTAAPVDPPPPGGPIPWLVTCPRFGLSQWVFDGNADRIVNSGHTWHWTGTGLAGQGGNIVLFGHRTEAGGPYRHQHRLRNGDLLYLHTSDARRYTYRMVAEYVTSKYSNDILSACRRVRGETVSLVSCSKPNGEPTSLQYRLVSTFQLVGWDDLG
ncbi:MAG TPA: sortase [Ilumatobacteraceae bacterium]|nr:sortase [Ilumatobacteraceae bacterium]